MKVEYFIYVAIFLAVLLIVEGLYYLFVADTSANKAVNRRMQMLAAGGESKAVMGRLRRSDDEAKGVIAFIPWIGALAATLSQSGVIISLNRIIGIMAGLFVAFSIAILIFVSFIPSIFVPFISLPAAVLLPVAYLKLVSKRRIKKFSRQLPDTLDLIVRSLRAGHPISTSLSLVARELPDPMGTEIGIVVDEMTYGFDFREALDSLRERIPAPDLHFLVVTINIQHGSGGNLAEVLGNLSTVIRARFQMFAKIRALSAEGRISAIILSAIPFFVMAAVWMTTPGYYVKVMDSPTLPVIVGIALALELTAIAVMWKMVNFKV
jgi:tight adherence protein B